MALLHGRLLRDLLREVAPADHTELALRFAERSDAELGPIRDATMQTTRHRLAALKADAASRPHEDNRPKSAALQKLAASSLTDPDLARAFLDLSQLLATPAQVLARPQVVQRLNSAVLHPSAGSSRAQLLAVLRSAAPTI